MISEFAEQLSRRRKQAIAVVADAIALPVALWTALALRLGEWTPDVAQFWPAFVVSSLVCVPVFGGATDEVALQTLHRVRLVEQPAEKAFARGADEERALAGAQRIEAAQQREVVGEALSEADSGVENDA